MPARTYAAAMLVPLIAAGLLAAFAVTCSAQDGAEPSRDAPRQADAGRPQAGAAPSQAGAPTPMPKSCETPGGASISGPQLPRLASALKERKTIRILSIGGPSVSLGGRSESGPYGLIERYLEENFKGLDVVIIDRGVSGELAADAAQRMKTEVGLDDADLVLWQLGTTDAMAGVSADDLKQVISETASWLKEHNVDLILIGVRYAAQLAADPEYQAIRRVIREAAAELGVMRFGRWEVDETLARLRREKGQEMSAVEASDASYVCMAEYLARAIAAGLYARPAITRPAPSTPPASTTPGPTSAGPTSPESTGPTPPPVPAPASGGD